MQSSSTSSPNVTNYPTGRMNTNSSSSSSSTNPSTNSNNLTNPTDGNTIFHRSSHPIALFFHLFFRSAALLTYLLGYYLTGNFILIFVLCVLLLSFDFWTIKNVTGRLLVGLRWWNEIKENGMNEWVFESRENNHPNTTDSNIFWTALYVFPMVWAVFTILQLFHPSWACITVVALILHMANVIGYTKCDKDAKKRFSGYGESVLNTRLGQNVMGSFVQKGASSLFQRLFRSNRL